MAALIAATATFISWVISHKFLCLLIVASVALGVSTVVLGVQNANLKSEIEDLQSATTTPQITTSSTTTSSAATSSTTTSSTTTTTGTPGEMSKYRLPTTVKPLVYDLYLYPDLDTGLFSGRVIISLNVLTETNSVALHSNLLTIDNVTIGTETGKFVLEDTYELLTITKSDGSSFNVGSTTIEISFNGDMKNRIVGLYTSSYTTGSGESR